MRRSDPPLRVLVADDESGTRAMIGAVLRKLGLGVSLVADGREALRQFRETPHDMVLLDVDMPELDGFEVCALLRRDAGPALPIVMITGLDDLASVERAYEAGATDFIAKPINWAMLGHRLRHLVRNHQMQLALKASEQRIGELAESLQTANLGLQEANAELQRRAFEDPLSGLPNRALFNERLAQGLQRQARLAVMFIDLDGFKPINDSFGHAAGDEVLRDVARRLRAVVREYDTLARLDGDEFVTLIEGPEAAEDARRLGRRIIDALRRPFVIGDAVAGQRMALSCSIGVVVHPDEEPQGHRLLACADAAMYEAKRQGGSACVFYERGMSEDGTEQLLMQQALREALERGELSLAYQPKVDAKRGRIHGLEALLRWKSPRFGAVPPGVFIPLAERYGLIGALGNWVIDEACRQAAAWQAQGLACRVAINLSPHQLRQPDLSLRIASALQRHGVPAVQLVCEITESAMLENSEGERAALDRLAALGLVLSIDDFGTGYSSLAHLRLIPARQLKIDRSFVVDLDLRPQARAMVEAIVRLGHALDMEVVAEGVETEAQMLALRELGCDLLQGYFFARPMPAEAVPEWLAGRDITDFGGLAGAAG